MKKTLKDIFHQFQIRFFPEIYKKRFFKSIRQLNWKYIRNRNIENELLLISYFLQKDSCFIDIGANLGQYLFKAEKLIEKENIYAFEPHPLLYKRLRNIFKGPHIFPYAVSSNNEKSQFKIPFFDEREIHTRGTLKTDYVDVSETDFKLISVDVIKLDSFIKTLGLKNITLIKIDVEGAEMDVIEGAWDTLAQYQPILIIEIEQQHHQTDIHTFIRRIEEKGGYKGHYFDPVLQQLKDNIHELDLKDIQSMQNHGKNRMFINNFIFLPLPGVSERVKDINLRIKGDS